MTDQQACAPMMVGVGSQPRFSKIKRQLSKLKVVIISHTFATGPTQELETFLYDKVLKLAFIGHPFSYSKTLRSSMKICNEGVHVKTITTFEIRGPELLLYAKDFVASLLFVIKTGDRFHLCIAADPLNTFAGLVLRAIGFVQKVIFYPMDYVPLRFKNNLLNRIYHMLDNICVTRSDFTWNPSEAMITARKMKLPKKDKLSPQIITPGGAHFERIEKFSIEEIDRHNMVFLGHVREGHGLKLVIETIPQLLHTVPDLTLTIIGDGPLKIKLEQMVSDLEIKDHVKFLGYVEDHKKIERIIAKCAFGLAIYEPTKESFSWYGDPGKVKQYAACGLPTIITRVPRFALEVERRNMGIVINYNQDEFFHAALKLLMDDDNMREQKRNALSFASQYSWETVYYEALEKSLSRTGIRR